MRVTVRLFARLRDITGAAELPREVAAGRDDRHRLAGSWPASSRRSPTTSDRFRRAVNADYARMDAEVHDGDEIAFLAASVWGMTT